MHIASVDIEFDPDKAASKLSKHKVSFAHAEQALRDSTAVTIEDPDAEGELRLVTLGMDSLGRVLIVAHTQRVVSRQRYGRRASGASNFGPQSKSR